MSLNNVIAVAWSELGNSESPAGSNRTKYGAAYGMDGQPWCVMFLWWVFQEAGAGDAFYGGRKTASCTQLKNYYLSQGNWIIDGNYQPGDIAIMTFSSSREIQHCGLIVEKLNSGKYKTIEGNTSSGIIGSQDNGGCVALRTRKTSNILGVCRINYLTAEEDEDLTNEKFAELMDNYLKEQALNPVPEWAQKELQEAIDLGITDGTRPMQLIPRYQAAIMALRAAKAI